MDNMEDDYETLKQENVNLRILLNATIRGNGGELTIYDHDIKMVNPDDPIARFNDGINRCVVLSENKMTDMDMENDTTALTITKPQPIYFGVDFAFLNIHCSAQSGSAHIILTPQTCKCKRSDGRCPTCDWGLSVCAICGAAESQLDYDCMGENDKMDNGERNADNSNSTKG